MSTHRRPPINYGCAQFGEDAVRSMMEAVLDPMTIDEQAVVNVCELAELVLLSEANVLYLESPVTIFGDIHGQLYDLQSALKLSGHEDTGRFLFLGDYVDRGRFSLQTFLLLLCKKLLRPGAVFLLRGNHESWDVNEAYGFYQEILERFGNTSLWRVLNNLFDLLPMAAVVDGTFFCCHGGLSPLAPTVFDIGRVDRRGALARGTLLSDLCWSDPDVIEGWLANQRGAGWVFGVAPTQQFLASNRLKTVVRAHQLCEHGYQPYWDYELVTIWSAPNYAYRSANKGAIMDVDDGCKRVTFKQFEAVPDEQRFVPARDGALFYFV